MVDFEPGDDSLGIRMLIAVMLVVGILALIASI